MRPIVVDTSFIVALLARRDPDHALARTFQTRRPLLTCEAVISEADHLLGAAPDLLLQNAWLIERLRDADDEIIALMKKYADQPMSYADAYLVALAARNDTLEVLTFDSNFFVYRSGGKRFVLLPEKK